MKRPSRFLRVFGVAGLLLSLFAATLAPAVAQDPGDGRVFIDFNDVDFRSGSNTIYYPWVANGEDFGLGASQTSISVQNLDDEDTTIFIYVGNSSDDDAGFELETSAFLSAFAAKTFTADQLGIAEGSGAPVAVVSFSEAVGDELFPDVVPGTILTETVVLLSKPENVTGDFTQVNACVVNASSATTNPGLGSPVGFVVAADFTFEGVDYEADDDDDTTNENNVFVGSFTQEDLQTILNDVNEGNTGELINPFGGLINDADCDDIRIAGTPGTSGVPGVGTNFNAVAIGGVAKQAVTGDNLPSTTSEDTAVSGYNALNGAELERFGEQYLPIVQTNCGPGGCWDSVIRVANLRNENNAVTVDFFPSDDAQGSLDTGFQVQETVDAGDTVNINLSDFVPEGWVGSAHIQSDGTVFAMVDRYKVGYDMWITNTSSSADFENVAQVENAQGRYALFAPHVLLDYFGWNTGINVANLADVENNVSIQYFNLFGNATQVLNQRIAVDGMTFFYDPSQPAQDNNNQDIETDVNANVVGSAIIWSDEPVAAAIDATKYPETDPNGGLDVFQATSYSATQNLFEFQAVPLFQKGNPVDGLGDTSGVNIMNPNAEAATVNVFFVNPSGFLADNFGTSSVTIPGFANGFVYSMTQRNLPNGFTGAIQVVSNLPVAAVSANVNYAVDGDGSAIFNAFNPCGFFRVTGGEVCDFGDPFDPTDASFTKIFVDQFGDPIQGVNFSVVNTNPDFGFQRDGVSQADGSMTFENLRAGNYTLFVDSVPAGITPVPSDEVLDSFTLETGEDESITNILTRTVTDTGFEKTVVVEGTETGVAGVDVIVFEFVGTSADGFVVGGEVFPLTGEDDTAPVTGDDGSLIGNIGSGEFVLCIFDEDGIATTDDDDDDDLRTTVFPILGDAADLSGGDCEQITVEDGTITPVTNTVDLSGSITKTVTVLGVPGPVTVTGIDVSVFAAVETATPGEFEAGELIFTGETGVDGSITSAVGVGSGTFILCIFDADGTATTSDGETVTPNLSASADFESDDCEVVEVEDAANTAVVNPITFEGQETVALVVSPENTQGFEQPAGQTGTVTFVEGPADPPSGEGSVRFTTAEGDSSSRATFENDTFAGVDIVDLTALSYHTFLTDGSSTGVVVPAIKLPVLYDDGDVDGQDFTTLVFEPVYSVGTQDVTPGVWQEWDAFSPDARWYSTRDIGGGICAFTCYVPFEDIEDQIPDAFLITLQLETGSGTPGADGNVDLLTVGVNGTNFVYDFEPSPTP